MRIFNFESISKLLSAVKESYVCWALIALIVLDCICRLTYSAWPLDRFNSPNRSAIYWATKDFRAHCSPHPDVILLGSSLMMAALHGGDATFLDRPQNVTLHHRSLYLEHLMSERLRAPISTFAFAIGGQMVSDAFVITSTLFKVDYKPKTIVYGIAPRDFMDNTLKNPASTETFRYMNRIGSLAAVDFQARSSFWERAEWAVSQLSCIYSKRLDFLYLQNKYARSLLSALFGMKNLDMVQAPFPLRKIAMFELPEDSGPNELMILPFRQQDQRYSDNSDEYRKRYRSFRKELFNMQLSFLERLLQHCQDEGIDLVLVNMPLTIENVKLMPAGFYDHYLGTVKTLAAKYQAHVMDLNVPDEFPLRMFADSVHLNGSGGVKFFDLLSESLARESKLALTRRTAVR